MRFRRIRGVKHSVFTENAEWNCAFSAITRCSRKSGYVLGFNTYLNKIFEILGLGHVYYWMMPKNCDKRTIKSRACVPLNLNRMWRRYLSNRYFLSVEVTTGVPCLCISCILHMCVPRVKISILSSNQTLSVAFRMFDTDTEIIASWLLVGPNLDPELFIDWIFRLW